jgi:hypothetical protein
MIQAKEPRLKYLGLQVEENEDFTVGAKRSWVDEMGKIPDRTLWLLSFLSDLNYV